MLCLGIESSCDDTSVALVRNGRLVAQETASQVPLHALFGGVVPELASREHHKAIGTLCDRLLSAAGCSAHDIDVVSVARGPGLLGSLLVGVSFAKAFAFGCGARILAVNHLHAHLLAYGLEEPLVFPAVGLLVSGGHTHLYRMDSLTEFTLLGTTLDDAAGEAFDKAGKMLGLPYPAGRFIDELSQRELADPKLFPRPYLGNDVLDFSFSGLKTAMATYLAKHQVPLVSWDADTALPEMMLAAAPEALRRVCSSYSLAIVETLVYKTKKALEQQNDVKALVLAGGVAANSMLRSGMQVLAETNNMPLLVPPPKWCTDNGAMIAHLGALLANEGFYHKFSFESIPRGRKIPADYLCR